jgi:streptogramin lyase
MSFRRMRRWLAACTRTAHRPHSQRGYCPRLEGLENRLVPTGFRSEFLVPTANSGPFSVAAGADGNLWFTEANTNHIGRVSPRGQFVEIVLPTSDVATEIVSGPDGNLWFTEQAGNKVGRITLDGTVTLFSAGLTASAGPAGITVGPDNALWFTEFSVGKIGRITTSGQITEFALPRNDSGPFRIAAGLDGNLWFTEQFVNQPGNVAGQIGRITTAGKVSEFAVPSSGTSNVLWGIAPGSDGNVWFVENGSDQIGRITPTGTISVFPLPVVGSAPRDLKLAPDGNLWFTEFTGGPNSGSLGRITPVGAISEFPIPTANSFPNDLTIGSDGNLWFTEFNSNRVGDFVMPHFIVTGAGTGGGPDVRVVDESTGQLVRDFFPYVSGFTGGVRVAMGDINHDGIPDIVTAPGPGGGPDVKVFDGVSGKLIREFLAYAPQFSGGVNIAVGDVNEDGYADIIVGADAGGGPEVKVYDGKTGGILFDFYAYDPRFTGGARVAAADVNGDGHADVIAGAGPGGGPHVKVFDGTNASHVIQSFMAYAITFSGGVYVSGGDTNEDGFADIVVGPGAGGGPNVRVFSGANGSLIQSFMAYASQVTTGVRVAAFDVDGDTGADIITAPGPGGGPQVKVFDGVLLNQLDSFFAYDPQFAGGVYVGGH